MYEALLAKIAETLATVSRVKLAFNAPKTAINKWPAVFYKPVGLENNYETQTENAEVYRFMILILIGVTPETVEQVAGTILPKTADEVKAAFNEQWDYGTIDGHRVRGRIYQSGDWDINKGPDGLVAYAPFELEVRLLTDV